MSFVCEKRELRPREYRTADVAGSHMLAHTPDALVETKHLRHTKENIFAACGFYHLAALRGIPSQRFFREHWLPRVFCPRHIPHVGPIRGSHKNLVALR